MVEKIVGKGENTGYKMTFSPFPTMFSKGIYPRVIKTKDYLVKSHTFHCVHMPLIWTCP